MGTNEWSQSASKSSWDSQDFGDVRMVLKMVHFRKSTWPQWVKSLTNRNWSRWGLLGTHPFSLMEWTDFHIATILSWNSEYLCKVGYGLHLARALWKNGKKKYYSLEFILFNTYVVDLVE